MHQLHVHYEVRPILIQPEWKCVTFNELRETCDVMMATNDGCVNGKDGFFKREDGKTCGECHESCSTCLGTRGCMTCSDGYYRYSGEGNCTSYELLEGCVEANKTKYGCTLCSLDDGYYLKDGECKKCSGSGYFLMGGTLCVHYTTIPHCTAASMFQCADCETGYKLGEDGLVCERDNSFVGLVVGLSVGFGLFIAAVLIVIIVCAVLIHRARRLQKLRSKDVCVFKIKLSNIGMMALGGDIVSNKGALRFNDDADEIPVNRETRELLCIGNVGKNRLKVQFTTREGCNQYEVRAVPKLVTLKPGEACEFEIFIKPLCTCSIEDKLMVVRSISTREKRGKSLSQ